MLRTIACRLIAAESDAERAQLAMLFLNICALRYPWCKRMLVEYVNAQLRDLGVPPLDDEARSAPVTSIIDRIVANMDAAEPPRSRRDTEKHASLARHIIINSVLAIMDALGIEC